ncbi:MAG: HAMP domain-containing protein [Deltaproteobacteria bacterium]|nr:HAMP domain-containing protein [Deltaproteobacteria bacterium]
MAEEEQTEAQTESQEEKQRSPHRRETVITVVIISVVLLFFFFQNQMFKGTAGLPVSNTIVILAIVDLNILLILLVLFLICRNLFRLFVERRGGTQTRLRSRLVMSFVSLSLLPTLLLFFAAAAFITNSIENWFNTQIETSLSESLEVAQTYYKNSASNALYYAEQIARTITTNKLLNQENISKLNTLIKRKQTEYNLSAVEVFSTSYEELSHAANPQIPMTALTETDHESIREGLLGNRFTRISAAEKADLIRGIVPIYSSWNSKKVEGVIVVNYYIPSSLINKIQKISHSFDQYRETKLIKEKIKLGYIIILLLITLLIIFLATWVGLLLAKQITGPIQALALATDEVANGNLDISIEKTSQDEIGKLIDAFNQMTSDLRRGQIAISNAYQELQAANTESEQRRRYMEVVLRNVTAGVVSVDTQGRFTTINKAAEDLLHINGNEIIGKTYLKVMNEQSLAIVREFVCDLAASGRDSIQKQIVASVGDNSLTLLICLTTLRDETGASLGTVVVFDDLTQLIKAQRMAAWREVARRIAHEIKNPLTPIKLSAQRLRRRYLDRFSAEETVFDECTNMIIQQVDEMKILVDEFSRFARLPTSHPLPNDLNQIVSETMVLYQEGHREIHFSFQPDPDIPIFDIDHEQMKRAIGNLLANAVDAVAGIDGEIKVETNFISALQIANVIVSDNGCGISYEDKSRLFEPYFSTKKSGTGLGLVITSTIIADHNGYVRVRNNEPKGTCFIVELPVSNRSAAMSFHTETTENL